MFRVWTNNLGRVGKAEAHVYFLALTGSDTKQLGNSFLLKGNFINALYGEKTCFLSESDNCSVQRR